MKLILFQFLAILIVTSAAMVDTDLVGEDEPKIAVESDEER